MNNSYDANNELHSSWEVVEGSSIIMEVESSFKSESITSKRNNGNMKDYLHNDLNNRSIKSSESQTATFKSATVTKNDIKEETKKNKNKKQEGPFFYGPNSEEDDYDSELEEHSFRSKQSNRDSKTTPTKTHKSANQDLKETIEQKNHKNSEHHSEVGANDDGWIGGNKEKKVPQSVRGNGGRRINDSVSSSQQVDSLSTHTSPQFQAHPKLVKQKNQKSKYMDHKEFKGFIEKAKQQVISEKSNKSKDRKKWISPLRIVDKLVDDAQRRLKNKNKNEPIGQDTPFANVYSKWTGTLRNKTPQPPARNQNRTRSKIGSINSRAAGSSVR